MAKPTHVAVAIIVNTEQQVLLAFRHAHQHQGGLWEFPGGKIEPNEGVYDALVREIQEELGIAILSAQPFIKIPHDYSDRSVLLDVWLVSEFTGTAQGQEGQSLQWRAIEELVNKDFPMANGAIIEALKLHEFS